MAALVQLAFIMEGFVKPTLLNTQVKEINLSDIDFPLDIKICVMPGFNETALNQMGYKTSKKYFKGESKFNESIFGWAGHTPDLGVRGSVGEVLDAVRNHRVEEVIEESEIEFKTGKKLGRTAVMEALKILELPRLA